MAALNRFSGFRNLRQTAEAVQRISHLTITPLKQGVTVTRATQWHEPGADPNGSSSGLSYVVFGKASGFASNLNLSALDGPNGFRLSGVATDDISGDSISDAGAGIQDWG